MHSVLRFIEDLRVSAAEHFIGHFADIISQFHLCLGHIRFKIVESRQTMQEDHIRILRLCQQIHSDLIRSQQLDTFRDLSFLTH